MAFYFSYTFNGKQWSKFVSLVTEGQMEKAREYLKPFVQSLSEIGFKKKKVKPPTRSKKVLAGGGFSADELSEPLIVRERFGHMGSDGLYEAVNWNKWSDPKVSKVFLVKEPDEVLRGQGLFVRTPRGDQPLDYNSPEVLRWLRQTEISQKKTLKTVIEGGSKTGRVSITPLKEAVKGSVDDLDALVY